MHFLDTFLKNTQIKSIMKTVQRCSTWTKTDRHYEANSRFSQFCKHGSEDSNHGPNIPPQCLSSDVTAMAATHILERALYYVPGGEQRSR